MKWIITEHVHYDRTSTPWLIKRFIDKDAEFSFAPASEAKNLPKDAIPLAFPGAKLVREGGSLFIKVLREYKVQDPALEQVATVVNKGVAYATTDYRPEKDDLLGQMSVGLIAFADGLNLVETDDQKRLDKTFMV